MATEPLPPPASRTYRAACPNCGAPVEFRSAASPMAVCGFCRSTLLRDGDALQRIGTSAELFDDHSPLQLGASGRMQGAGFTLVGRLQMRYAGGSWNEWHAWFDDGGRSGWLSEDNGQYVLSFEAPLPGPLPPPEALHAGAQQVLGGTAWQVASVQVARVAAAQGELAFVPQLERAHVVAELRNPQGEVGVIDYGGGPDDAAPRWFVGRPVRLDDLAMTGLREASEKTLKGRSLECPACGAALEPRLEVSRSIACHQCHAVVDLSGRADGAAAGLAHHAQAAGLQEPLLALGSTGMLALGSLPRLPWQVVGYLERRDLPEDADEESTYWREYLIYHRTEGFAFLVDTEEGWSWTRPLTGAPRPLGGDRVAVEGDTFRRKYSYAAVTTYVQGEFYWQVERDQRSRNTDYEGTGRAARRQLSREESGSEVTWSLGEKLDAGTLMEAFRVEARHVAAFARDAAPLAGSTFERSNLAQRILWGVLVLMVVVAVAGSCSEQRRCEELRATFGPASNEYLQCKRSGGSVGGARGGSYGGWSSGGGHK